MFHQPPDKVQGSIAQPVLGLGIIENIGTIAEEGEVYVHAGAADAINGFGHKSGVEIMLGGYCFDHKAKSNDIIGSAEGIGIPEVNFVLPRGYLMMGGLNLKSHFLQGQNHVPPGIFADVDGGQVKVTGPVTGDGGRVALGIPAKEEELWLRAGIH